MPDVQVNFPSKMKVESPKTDAAIDALKAAFDAMSRMLQATLPPMAGSLKTLEHLPKVLTTFQAQVGEQLGSLLRYQLEAQLQLRNAGILTASRQRESLREARTDKLAQLPGDTDRVATRYTDLISKAAEQTEKHIRRLDSHALDIMERIYPQQLAARFSFESTPVFALLAEHAEQVAGARSLALDEALGRARAALTRHLADRAEFLGEVDAACAPAVLEPGWYEVPVVLAEVENADGSVTRRADVVGGADLPAEVRDRLIAAAWARAETAPPSPLDAGTRRRLADVLGAEHGSPADEQDRLVTSELQWFGQEG